jgi:serine O-acetyltransferase
MNAFKLIGSDYKKIRGYGASPLSVIFLNQGFWACFQYRLSHSIYTSGMPVILRKICMVPMLLWQKVIEIITGISLPASASIGHSFYIGHFGPIIVHPAAVIGNNCNISQGVTIGISGRDANRGVPVIGDRVYIGPNAVIAGKIKVGDHAVIGALTLVVKDVPENAVVSGVPAIVISLKGSEGYI